MGDVTRLDHLSIEDRLATFTEYNLATLETLQDRKRSSKSEIRRQANICDQMVRACQTFGATGPMRYGGPSCSRLHERLTTTQEGPNP